MMDGCTVAPPGSGFISSVSSYIDCQAQILGSGAWAALAAPGSTLAVVLTGFLTILIALIGYNLLLGNGVTVRSGTITFVKIGAVFALATSWPAYRTLVYDLVTDGPSQLVAEIGPQAGVVGSDGSLLQRLDFADQGLARLAVLGAGNPPAEIAETMPPPPFGGFDTFALGGSRILFELTALAGLSAVRITAGLMLGLGPFFVAFLLFESTRSLFEGWVRALGGAMLAAVGVSICLGLELAFLEPWLSDALGRRTAGEALPGVPTELFVVACLFTIIVCAAIYACARVALAFRFAPLARVINAAAEHRSQTAFGGARSVVRAQLSSDAERSRAAAVASVFQNINGRERRDAALIGTPGQAGSGLAARVSRPGAQDRTPVPVGRSFTRRSSSTRSRSAAKRDAGA